MSEHFMRLGRRAFGTGPRLRPVLSPVFLDRPAVAIGAENGGREEGVCGDDALEPRPRAERRWPMADAPPPSRRDAVQPVTLDRALAPGDAPPRPVSERRVEAGHDAAVDDRGPLPARAEVLVRRSDASFEAGADTTHGADMVTRRPAAAARPDTPAAEPRDGAPARPRPAAYADGEAVGLARLRALAVSVAPPPVHLERPPVRVTIGRIEVRAVAAPAPPSAAVAPPKLVAPSMTLADYLARPRARR